MLDYLSLGNKSAVRARPILCDTGSTYPQPGGRPCATHPESGKCAGVLNGHQPATLAAENQREDRSSASLRSSSTGACSARMRETLHCPYRPENRSVL